MVHKPGSKLPEPGPQTGLTTDISEKMGTCFHGFFGFLVPIWPEIENPIQS
jgi:hypothetical protein